MRQCHIQSVLCTLVVPVLLVAGCGQCPTDGRESPGDKREWSILQALEFRHRSVPITGLESQTLEGYEVLVVPGADNQQRIWIMLAPRHPPFYKQVPEGSYWLARDEVGQLARKHKISSTVEQVLRSHLRPEAK